MKQEGHDDQASFGASRGPDAEAVPSDDTVAVNDMVASADGAPTVVSEAVEAPAVVSDVPPHDDDPPSHAAGPLDRMRRATNADGKPRRRIALLSWKGIAVVIAALVLGGAAGAAALAPTIMDKQDKISALKRQKSSIQTGRNQLASKLNSRESKQRADEAAAQRAFQERMSAEAAQQKKDDATAKAAAAATAAAKDTVDHDGVFGIGTEKNAGRYTTDGGATCYYAILNSPAPSDIATSALPAGPATVDLPTGKFFQTANCGVWKRVA
jgi:hypothetical protein